MNKFVFENLTIEVKETEDKSIIDKLYEGKSISIENIKKHFIVDWMIYLNKFIKEEKITVYHIKGEVLNKVCGLVGDKALGDDYCVSVLETNRIFGENFKIVEENMSAYEGRLFNELIDSIRK